MAAFQEHSELRLAFTRRQAQSVGDAAAATAYQCQRAVKCERDTVAQWSTPQVGEGGLLQGGAGQRGGAGAGGQRLSC